MKRNLCDCTHMHVVVPVSAPERPNTHKNAVRSREGETHDLVTQLSDERLHFITIFKIKQL